MDGQPDCHLSLLIFSLTLGDDFSCEMDHAQELGTKEKQGLFKKQRERRRL